ncbi:MAG: bifunctional N-acetyltransferase/class I SAM-dependent methyltransferase [Deltaproteobacteria bacterium]|nr:bifunctional N-acetyltransferase/class I SAM-dependent methyltransferase [Myxococcales bacterium]MDP3217888.1 bifunctional N-acetyltransferase/class I SAM-dependent methyltransferase [Deltaproteobacteria bacterium]
MRGDDYDYDWRSGDHLDDALLAECSELFSMHYGVWGASGPRPGKQISLSPSKVREFVPSPGWAVLARRGGELVGYALGIRKTIDGFGTMDWVTQLVVHTEHRNRGVATQLLFTFWGFSDHAAWGLVTTNPYAVRALEHITHRRCDLAVIGERLAEIRAAGEGIPYAKDRPIEVTGARSVIDTAFFISHEKLPDKLRRVKESAPWQLGEIAEGEEWLAFTFRSQRPKAYRPDELKALLDRSDRTARNAYARMAMGERHAWARHAAHEVEVAVDTLALTGGERVLDVGCGRGRHTHLLGQHGCNAVGVDFVEAFVTHARAEASALAIECVNFFVGDARTLDLTDGGYDAALCLYDVIGTFPDQAENQRIVDCLARHLRPGGRLLASVMNLELTSSIASLRLDDVANLPEALQALPPSRTMQQSGNVYDPKYFLLDPEGVVYRKEQFDDDGKPPGEYVVRDRRYTRQQVREMCERAGLRLVWARPVALGRWTEALEGTDPRAKEILFLAERSG